MPLETNTIHFDGKSDCYAGLHRFKQHVCVVDTSNDIVGAAAQPHFCLGSSRRFQVRWRIADQMPRHSTPAPYASATASVLRTLP